ncbi:MAG: transposase [Cyanobacterium sp. T60_A2020_053]|nr:transposase [Cyanobacterium sp. T60_A2020_053]
MESERIEIYSDMLVVTEETRYYITSLEEGAQNLARRIRGYWGVENKVHYVRDVTQGEDASRIRTSPLVGLFVQARNMALNLYREYGWTNMAQAQRLCSQSLDKLIEVFRMK